MRGVLPGLLAATLLLAGCGGSEDGPASVPPPGGSIEPSAAAEIVPPAPPLRKGGDQDLKALEDLAALAEKAAKDVPLAQVRSFPGPVLGADMSWPQCPKGMGIPQKRSHGAPPPLDAAQYVVLGLTNGPGFTPNPCLADQVSYARSRKLLVAAYAVASYPDAATVERHGDDGPFDPEQMLGALANVGYQQARFNVGSMRRTGLVSPLVWIDVEPVPDFEWSGDVAANAAVVQGLARGYVDAGLRIGVYSTPSLWSGVVGGLSLEVPEWRAAGQTSRAEAASRCGADWDIQGGEPVMGQWVEQARDQNITCPGVHRELGRWFHEY